MAGKDLSLSRQITILTSILCIAIVAVVAGASTVLGRREAIEQASHALASVTTLMADRLDRGMQFRLQQMKVLSDLEALQGLWTGGPERIRAALDRMQAGYPDYAWIGFADPAGKVIGATHGMLEGASVADRPWFLAGLKGASVGDVREATLLSGLLKPLPGGEPIRLVDFAAPVQGPDGKLLGVLAANLSWEWAKNLRKSLQPGRDDSIEIWVLARDGRILLGPNVGQPAVTEAELASIRERRRGTFQQSSDAGRMLVGFSIAEGLPDFQGLGWIVLARQPRPIALAAADRLTWTIGLLGVFVTLMGIVFASRIAAHLARPIMRLSAAADRIGRDSESGGLPFVAGSREVVQLSGSLRSLMRRTGTAERRAVQIEMEAEQRARRHALDLEALKRLADTDPLSGLLNRRSFLAAADEAFDYYKRYGRGIGVLVVDIDHFKRVNDAHGHAAGDAVIRNVGQHLAAAVRGTDRVARFGGEEFVVLLREIGVEGVLPLAERIRGEVRSSVVVFEGKAITVTISLGGALIEPTDRDIQDLIERADLALYEAKAGGRNRFSMSPGASSKVAEAAA
jgi:diguanylate cyclase (GGDEF)-like protein